MKKIIKFILLFSWMFIIFMFSNQAAVKSGALTRKVSNIAVNVINKEIESETKGDIVEKVFLPLRKGAHFFIYFILGMLIYTLLKEYMPKYKFILTIILVLLYAISDELHQNFVAGRTGTIKDVFIDSFGGITGAMAMKLKYRIQKIIF